MDRRGGTGPRRPRRDRAARTRLRHLPGRVDAGPSGGPRGARTRRGDSRSDCPPGARELRDDPREGGGRSVGARLTRRRWLVCSAAGADARQRRGSRARSARHGRGARPPRIFLRFPARIVFDRQPAAAGARVHARHRTAAAALRLQRGTLMNASAGRRRAGILIPLFSIPSTASWGIGDIGDVEPVTSWLAAAGVGVLQLLPLNEMAPGQQSPYSAISAMAIDPIFIRVPDVAEFEALGGEGALSADDRATLARVRQSPRIRHHDVRALKRRALRSAFERFLEREWRGGSERARAFQFYVSEQAWWIEDYSLFRALHAREHERPWTEWPEALQRREPPAIDRVRRELADEVLFQQYLQ